MTSHWPQNQHVVVSFQGSHLHSYRLCLPTSTLIQQSLRKLKSKTSKFSLLEDVKYEKPVAKQAFWVKHWKGTSENERKMSYHSGAINYV